MSHTLPKLLAISSGGGHWVQLLRVRSAFEGCRVVYATVSLSYRSDVEPAEFFLIPDSNRWQKFALLRTALAVLILVVRYKPDVVVTTGAAPGYFGARIGKLFGSRVIWIDSVANAEEISMSGRLVGSFVDLWLTQWPHLARRDGPTFIGSVL